MYEIMTWDYLCFYCFDYIFKLILVIHFRNIWSRIVALLDSAKIFGNVDIPFPF